MGKPEKKTTEDELLTYRLCAIYRTVVDAALGGAAGNLLNDDHSLNDNFVIAEMPDCVMDLAALLDLIPHQTNAYEVAHGRLKPYTPKDPFGIPASVRADVMKRIRPEIDYITKEMKRDWDAAEVLRQRTPRQTIINFCKSYGLERTTSFVTLVGEKTKNGTWIPSVDHEGISYVSFSTRTAIERLIKVPDLKKEIGQAVKKRGALQLNSAAQRNLSERIFSVIKKHDSKKKFPDLVLDDLLWTEAAAGVPAHVHAAWVKKKD